MASAILDLYFKKLWFTFLEFNNEYAMYGAKIYSMFQKDATYVFAFVDTTKTFNRVSRGRERLESLAWVSLQTRLIPKDEDTYGSKLALQELKINSREVDGPLRIQSRSAQHSVYLSEDGTLQVELLHNKTNPSIYQYNNNIMISTAVELFQSVFVKV